MDYWERPRGPWREAGLVVLAGLALAGLIGGVVWLVTR